MTKEEKDALKKKIRSIAQELFNNCDEEYLDDLLFGDIYYNPTLDTDQLDKLMEKADFDVDTPINPQEINHICKLIDETDF